MRHRGFTDNAGFTRHCWECLRALQWQDGTAWCETRGIVVGRYDSPDNGSSVAGGCPSHKAGK